EWTTAETSLESVTMPSVSNSENALSTVLRSRSYSAATSRSFTFSVGRNRPPYSSLANRVRPSVKCCETPTASWDIDSWCNNELTSVRNCHYDPLKEGLASPWTPQRAPHLNSSDRSALTLPCAEQILGESAVGILSISRSI